MNVKLIFHIVSWTLMAEGLIMLIPLGVGFFTDREGLSGFVAAVFITVLAGLIMRQVTRGEKGKRLSSGEAFAAMTFSWIAMSFFGAIPFAASGAFGNYSDALFECVSGLSTTGISVLTNVEDIPKSLLFWRSFTQFLGGIGVLTLFLAILPISGGGRGQLLRFEKGSEKLVPKMSQTVLRLGAIYAGFTLIETLVLRFAANIPLFDAVTLSFSTAGTGGFSVRDGGVAEYASPLLLPLLGLFMLIFSVNFAVYYDIAAKRRAFSLKNHTEFKVFLCIAGGAFVLVWLDLVSGFGWLGGLGQSVFGVSSFMSTTVFDWEGLSRWPDFAALIVTLLVISGSCSGSTGGGIKIYRVLLMCKGIAQEFKQKLRPRSVNVVRMDGKAVDAEQVRGAFLYFVAFCGAVLILTLALTVDRSAGEAFAAAIACLTNTGGSALARVNYGEFSGFSKAVMMIGMLLGRLELFPVLILFTPTAWRKK